MNTLGRRNLYMLPTRHGAIFAVVLLAMLLISVNYANALAYMFTFLLASLVMVSMLYTHRNLSGLEVSVGRCHSAFAGSRLGFEVCLQNHSDRRRYDVGVDVEGSEGQRLNLSPGELVCLPCEMNVNRRGWVKLPAVQVNTRYPIGIMFTWSRGIGNGQKCLVYPRPGPLEPFQAGGEGGVISDSHTVSRPGHDDFAGLKPYQVGDALQHVDWKSFARGKGMHTKTFAVGQLPDLVLDWDATRGTDTESRLSLMTRWVIEADKLGIRYGMSLPGKQFAPDNGDNHKQACLRELALF